MKTNPCKHCVPPKRTPTCHSTCKDYKDWKAEWDAMREKQRKENDFNNSFRFRRKY